MLSPGIDKKTIGMALYLVIGTLIIVVILCRAILVLIISQQRITHHNVARIQAYYAAKAGMNYALEMLRQGNWTYTSDTVNSCPNPTGCIYNESEFPNSIGNFSNTTGAKEFKVVFCPYNATSPVTCAPSTVACNTSMVGNYPYCVNISVKYTSPDIPT